MTELKGPLKRELTIGASAYVLTISPERLKLAMKGKRKGLEIAWRDLVNGDAAMAVALRASLDLPRAPTQASRKSRGKRA